MDWTKNNIKLDQSLNLTSKEKNSIGLLSEISMNNIKTNNIITSRIINSNQFWLELQLIPLADTDTFSIYTTNTVKNVVVKMHVFKIGSTIDTIKWSGANVSINKKKILWNFSIIWDQTGINWDVVNANWIWSDNFVSISNLSWENKFYYKDKGMFFDKLIKIKPFYNLDSSWGIIKQDSDPLFHPKYMYLIKIYFNLDKSKIDNFRLYIPNGEYITLNNIEKISRIKSWKKFHINKVKIIENWLINKINESKYWF